MRISNFWYPLSMQRWLFAGMLLFSLSIHAQGESSHDSARVLNEQVGLLLINLKATRDTATYYTTLQQVMQTALRCDAYDSQAGSNGRPTAQYRHQNGKRLDPYRRKLMEAALYYTAHSRNKEALHCYDLYLGTSNSRLFEGEQDSFRGQAAYYAALLAYGGHQYVRADSYADIAIRDTNFARDAAEIKVGCMREMMVTHNDSARYLIALLELHDKAPQNPTYFYMLLEYFSSAGHEKELEQFAYDEVRKDSTDLLAWLLLGEVKMKWQLWPQAVKAYKRAISLAPDDVGAIYNLGVCHSAMAQQMMTDDESEVSDSCRALLETARQQLERVGALDPEQEQVEWVKPLYQVYLKLGDREGLGRLTSRLRRAQQ